jgi:hypothetical protein
VRPANDIRVQRTYSPPNYTEYNHSAQTTASASAASSPLIIEYRTPSPPSPACDRRSPLNAPDITTFFATQIDRTTTPAPTEETYDNEIPQDVSHPMDQLNAHDHDYDSNYSRASTG